MEKPSFIEAFKFWLKLGFIGFGGPAGQIGIMREYLVERKKWISNAKFLHALNYCFLLPGPEAQQLSIYIGWLLHGVKGGLTAGILFVLPSAFILLGLSIIYALSGNIPWIYSLFDGLKPAVVAIIASALLKISQKSLKNYFHYIIAISSFAAIFFFQVKFPLIIFSAVLIGFILYRFKPLLIKESENAKNNIDEEGYFLNMNSKIEHTGFSLTRFLRQIIILMLCWLIPVFLMNLFLNDFDFWLTMSGFFTQAAFVTFGGAYAVLPYVAQVSVEQLNWLSKEQMIDGFALGETTPGPLIMILAFVGFMGGFNHFNGSILYGSIALFVTSYYTFMPCFFYIFAGAPIIEKTQENNTIKSILNIVSAAVVGVILNLTVYFGKAVIFPGGFNLENIDFTSIIWMILAFIAMYKFKMDMLLLIGISAIYGLVHHYFLVL